MLKKIGKGAARIALACVALSALAALVVLAVAVVGAP
jgi:hypothetical protein